MKLVFPNQSYKDKAAAFIEEFYASACPMIHGSGSLDRFLRESTYEDWLVKIAADMDIANIPAPRVPALTYFYVREEDDRIVGMINIRLSLNDYLHSEGGHIGYCVRPGERRRHYGTRMLQAALPVQPVGGKLQYYITVGGEDLPADEPLLLRFRNDVPAGILVPHILLMFAAMLFAVYTFLLVVTGKKYSKWLKITVATLFVGGFVFGPLVQHVAFGPWWTGFPYGTDLTDNKTLLAFLFFVAALATLRWKYNKWVVCLAVLFMIVIFSIPHSTYGSEYDYTTQQLGTGK